MKKCRTHSRLRATKNPAAGMNGEPGQILTTSTNKKDVGPTATAIKEKQATR
jgi:hypothetical protein